MVVTNSTLNNKGNDMLELLTSLILSLTPFAATDLTEVEPYTPTPEPVVLIEEVEAPTPVAEPVELPVPEFDIVELPTPEPISEPVELPVTAEIEEVQSAKQEIVDNYDYEATEGLTQADRDFISLEWELTELLQAGE